MALQKIFIFWKPPKIITRLDKVLADLLYDYKDYDREPANTAKITSIGAVTMLKAFFFKNPIK